MREIIIYSLKMLIVHLVLWAGMFFMVTHQTALAGEVKAWRIIVVMGFSLSVIVVCIVPVIKAIRKSQPPHQ